MSVTTANDTLICAGGLAAPLDSQRSAFGAVGLAQNAPSAVRL